MSFMRGLRTQAISTAVVLAATSLAVFATALPGSASGDAERGHKLIVSRAVPVAGGLFTGVVVVLPDDVRTQWRSFDVGCRATVGGRRLQGGASAFPSRAAVPTAVLCSWRIPRGSAGRRLTAVVTTGGERETGDVEVAEATAVRWNVRRR